MGKTTPKGLSFQLRQHVFNISRFFQVKDPLILLGILLFGIFAASELILQISAPPRQYQFSTIHSNPTLSNYSTKDPYETAFIGTDYYLAPGEHISINVSSSVRTELVVDSITFVGTSSNSSVASIKPLFTSTNTTNHIFILYSSEISSILRISIRGLENSTWNYEGSISFYGFNHILIFIPFFLIGVYTLVLLIRAARSSYLKGLLKRKKRKLALNSDYSFQAPVISRLTLLRRLQRDELGLTRIIILAIIIWVLVQPLSQLSFTNGAKLFLLNDILTRVEVHFVESFSSFNISFFFLPLFIALDSADSIASKRDRKDILISLSLPVKRSEWITSQFISLYSIYGSLFCLAILLKGVFISFQIGFIYPLISMICWVSFFLITVGVWITVGLLSSTTSTTRYQALIKTLLAIVFITFSMYILGGGLQGKGLGGLGILNLAGIAWQLWYNQFVQLQGLFVLSVPNIEPLLFSIILSAFWFFLCISLSYFVIRRYEVQ